MFRSSLLLLLIVAWPATASATSILTEQTKIIDTGHLELLSERWGVEAVDMKRYQEIMSGPALLWYKDLDPVWVLGIMSRSDNERMRYARIVLERERGRADNELKFQRAYDAARAERYPDDTLIDKARLLAYQTSKAQKRKSIKNNQSISSQGDKLIWFVRIKCTSCQSDYRFIRTKHGTKQLDIYFLDATDVDVISQWAANLKIDPDVVSSKRITLNFDTQATLCKKARCQPSKSSQLYWATAGLFMPIDPT